MGSQSQKKVIPAAQTVTRQFNQFPNFQQHQTKNSEIESPRQSAQNGRAIQKNSQNNNGRSNPGFSNNSNRGGNKNRNGNNQEKKQKKNFKSQSIGDKNSVEETANTEPHSPTSSSGLTIEEFLTRYPEVKRLSSRFNDDENTERPTEKPRKHKNNKNKKKEKDVQQHSTF